MKSKRVRIAIVALLFAIPIFFFVRGCVIPGIDFFSNTNLSKEEIELRENAANEEYLSLFNDETKKELRILNKYVIKPKHPFFIYGYGQHQILIYKVNPTRSVSLNELVLLKERNTKLSSGVTYSGLDIGHLEFNYSHDYDSLVKNIFLFYDDSLIQKHTLSDDIMTYDLQATNLYFRYEPDGINDFGFTTKAPDGFGKNAPKFKMSVLFYKRGKDVFIAVMYPNSRELQMTPPPLHSLIQIHNERL